MRLTEKEYETFNNIHPRLIHYAGIKYKLLSQNVSFDEFMDYELEEKYEIRNVLYDNIECIEQYIKQQGSKHTEEEITILRQFKNFKKGRFHVMQLTKKHAVFMDEDYVYTVLALGTPFEYLIGDYLPRMVDTVLLPFKDKIVYDGFLAGINISFGRGILNRIKNDLRLKKGQYGLISELPIKNSIKNKKADLAKTLLILMKTKASRKQNYYEIQELLDEQPELYAVYCREWGRINSRVKRKELKALGVKNYHFAISDDTVVCSGKTLKEIQNNVKKMILDKNLDLIHYFKV